MITIHHLFRNDERVQFGITATNVQAGADLIVTLLEAETNKLFANNGIPKYLREDAAEKLKQTISATLSATEVHYFTIQLVKKHVLFSISIGVNTEEGIITSFTPKVAPLFIYG